MNFIDFIIGVLLANALPHLIFGLTKTHFLGLFGYSPKGNIIYALVQFSFAGLLFVLNNDYKELFTNGYLIGGVSVLCLYFIFGKFLVNFYGKQK
jgi:hypothetical protein